MKRTMWCLLCMTTWLAACGGGGGGAARVPAAPVPDPVAAEDAAEEPGPLTGPEGDAVADIGEDSDKGEPGEAGEADFVVSGYVPAGSVPAPMAVATDASDAGTLTTPAVGRKTLYVSPKGADSNLGSADRPFRSIARAARAAKPGFRILVAPGTYTGGFRTVVDGAADARISFVSATKWGAKLVPAKVSPNKTAWDNRASYVDIVGFEVDGSKHQSGVRWTHGIYSGGSHDVIRNNHVHHIAQGNGCNRAGGAAIGVDSYYRGVHADVIANLVHDIGPAGCRYVQGIYVSTSGRVKNNVIYRVAEGGIHLWHDARDVAITNNTITNSNTGIIVGGGNFYHSKGPNDHTAVFSNIVVDNRMGISEQGRTGLNNSYRNNLVYQNSRYNWRLKNDLPHSDTVSAPPKFIAHDGLGQLNLKLSADSPAIGKGTPELAESTDFEGRARNAGAGYDIGAYQH